MEELLKSVDFIVLNKPAGVLMYRPKNDDIVRHNGVLGGVVYPTVADYLRSNYPETSKVGDDPRMRPGMVHRLDRDTSGCVVIARNQSFYEFLKRQFQTRTVHKEYLALVYGKLEGNRVISKPIGLVSGTTRWSTRAKNMKMVKPAVTEYSVIWSSEREPFVSLLRVIPKTGRTHQIRVHLASIGHSIVGDRLYGSRKQALTVPRQFLHAEVLEFLSSPDTKVRVEASLSSDLVEVLRKLGLSSY